MTLDQLRLFIAVAEREHVTAASQAMNVTQSAVSAAIAALEARYGIKLFHRVGRGIALTDAGRLFLPEARAVVAQASAAENVLKDISGLRGGQLKAVASQTIAAYWLPAILVAFRKRYPDIKVELAISNTEEAARMVREGEAEVGIVEAVVDDPALLQWPVGEDHLILVQANSLLPLRIDGVWLRQQDWVMREAGSGTRSALEHYLRGQGLGLKDLKTGLVLPSNEGVQTAIEAGAGIGALSSLVVGPALRAGTLHAVFQVPESRFFYGLRHKERYQSPAAKALLDMIEFFAVPRGSLGQKT
ncbi:LysR substrate-binding domain-containing protein [Gluconobacter kondonii]|uniref:LysR family transcriptional regulator n=1 Tax=Gluconobacter kondonii TaxID=941463 RepID=A0ABQ5WLQ2_9PROT|nr:LysR family transcriptional regulator [Gluconobacter kondonii]MCP1237326.1 LysR substrate-binding domain-containing protein [Gluconobacter kondonii]GBR38282.1 LysR family transcriptional regulator [Gluconobacter kondonii NBRC 3266]GLQ64433.1 LysR family transcriptional regulator [Gluconobacter kondonii]